MNSNQSEKKSNLKIETNKGDIHTMDELMKQMDDFSADKGDLIEGRVIGVSGKDVFVDIGHKSEGIVPITDFLGNPPAENDTIKVVISEVPSSGDTFLLSKKEADNRMSWEVLKEASDNNVPVFGKVLKSVSKGFIVLVEGREVFLPGAHVGHRESDKSKSFIGEEFFFKIIDLTAPQKTVVVSRKVLQDEVSQRNWVSFLEKHTEGETVSGIIKQIVVFGIFVEVDGVLGLLHSSDVSWKRVNKLTKMFAIGQEIELKILTIDSEANRLALGLKQLSEDPWDIAKRELDDETIIRGFVRSFTKYGAFVELQYPEGLEGMIHKSELSWTRKVQMPNEVLKKGQEVEAQILSINFEEKRISLGLRQVLENPWDSIAEKIKVGDVREGEITRITKYGAFVTILDDIEGLVHISDVSWDDDIRSVKKYIKKGQTVKYKILEIQASERRVSCGIKQLSENPYQILKKKYPRGSIINGEVTNISTFGLFVRFDEKFEGLVHISALANKRIEDIDEIKKMFKTGDKVGATILKIDPEKKKISLSIKDYIHAKEKENMKKYMGNDAPVASNPFAALANKIGK